MPSLIYRTHCEFRGHVPSAFFFSNTSVCTRGVCKQQPTHVTHVPAMYSHISIHPDLLFSPRAAAIPFPTKSCCHPFPLQELLLSLSPPRAAAIPFPSKSCCYPFPHQELLLSLSPPRAAAIPFPTKSCCYPFPHQELLLSLSPPRAAAIPFPTKSCCYPFTQADLPSIQANILQCLLRLVQLLISAGHVAMPNSTHCLLGYLEVLLHGRLYLSYKGWGWGGGGGEQRVHVL